MCILIYGTWQDADVGTYKEGTLPLCKSYNCTRSRHYHTQWRVGEVTVRRGFILLLVSFVTLFCGDNPPRDMSCPARRFNKVFLDSLCTPRNATNFKGVPMSSRHTLRCSVALARRHVTSSTSIQTTELQLFRDRLKLLGSGRIDLSLDDKTGLAALSLDNHEQRNALSGKMMAELADAVDKLEGWGRGVALTLQGAGGTFCSGADLSLARDHLVTGADGRMMSVLMTNTLDRLRRLPLISVAVIDGGAIGGGAELSTCCDFRVADPESFIRFLQVKMGVSTGWGGGTRLVDIVGRKDALRLLGWSKKINADEALAIGLVDTVASAAGGAHNQALELLEGVLEQEAYGAVRAAKSVVANTSFVSKELYDAEIDQFSALWGGRHNRQALESTRSPKLK